VHAGLVSWNFGTNIVVFKQLHKMLLIVSEIGDGCCYSSKLSYRCCNSLKNNVSKWWIRNAV